MNNMDSEKLYWTIKGLCFEFIYDWADHKYNEIDVKELVNQLIKNTRSTANPYKLKDKLEYIFKDAVYAFDLPEHPEKHNGYKHQHQYEVSVQKALGFSFKFHNLKPTTNATNKI